MLTVNPSTAFSIFTKINAVLLGARALQHKNIPANAHTLTSKQHTALQAVQLAASQAASHQPATQYYPSLLVT